ncbi:MULTISPECIES: hypothetical protein [Methylobacterium]|uniref:hypothetical protein n=1 Tax=Methylobacterium TaxID=407 RepID=UPI00272EDC24|nr:hypothetical protein [Methylobacterium sp.]
MPRLLQVGLLMVAAAGFGSAAGPARALDEVGIGHADHHGAERHGHIIERRETHGHRGEAVHREEHHEVVREGGYHGEERH